MNILVDIITLVLSVALVVLIVVQQRGGSGMGSSVFGGGGGGGGMPFFQRRGLEKFIYYITWGVAIGLLGISMFRVWF